MEKGLARCVEMDFGLRAREGLSREGTRKLQWDLWAGIHKHYSFSNFGAGNMSSAGDASFLCFHLWCNVAFYEDQKRRTTG